MPLAERTDELKRLIQAFESEAGKFYPLTLSLLYVTQDSLSFNHPIGRPNHAIMLWQYYGAIQGERGAEGLAKDLEDSDLKWGIRGAKLTCFGVLEGDGCELFVRMAQRAGALFDKDEASSLKSRMVQEILDTELKRHAPAKPTAASNDNPLALWLNYLLFHLSMTNPGRERVKRINPDPFTLSLLALERLYSECSIGKVDRSVQPLSALQFKVAMSFPGEQRQYVSATVTALRPHLPPDSIFYDYDYQAQLAKPNLDVLLQDIYRNRAGLVVIFLCKEYGAKQWCGLEWRAIRDLIKHKNDDQIMFVRFDDAPVEGVLSLDGYVDARVHSPEKLAEFIRQRIETSGA
ncbi:TIR domain-containing protein [Variovorax paradoxus]|uniref:TIR domain-containing protein n=1 Tax=Variovorax paradoxus TaxID=34073 RepID=UPI003D64AC43